MIELRMEKKAAVNNYQRLQDKLANGDIVIMDGAVGTELQRRGVAMQGRAWCALATETHPQILETIHRDYITAGAEIIIANTFASTREILNPLQMGDKFVDLNKRAVEIAINASSHTQQPVLVAGSIAHTRPTRVGEWSPARSPAQFEDDCYQMACLHKAGGCDFIMAEMLGDIEYSPAIMRAVQAARLPLWLGFSALAGAGGAAGGLVTYSSAATDFSKAIGAIGCAGADVAGMMHTEAPLTQTALALLKAQWAGVTITYPDSMPKRRQENEALDLSQQISEQQFVQYCQQWRAAGVQVFGGCCGLSVTHIAALTEAFK